MSKANILLVDHNPLSATEVFIALEDMGYSVFGPVGSESEALKAWNDGPPLAAIVNSETASIMQELMHVLQGSDVPVATFGEKASTINGSFKMKDHDLRRSLNEFLIEPGIAQTMIVPPEVMEEITAHAQM